MATVALDRLVSRLDALSPQLRKAAQYVLDHPNEVGVSSIRELADSAAVTPNTLVRMARAAGFDGYEDFRQPFREQLKAISTQSFPDRARWLQSIARGGRHGRALHDMAATCIGNVETLFSTLRAEDVKAAADCIVDARTTTVLGLGVLHPLATQFAYLLRMALDTVVASPRDGSLPMDDVLRAGRRDVLLAMTFEPYRSETVEAVRSAHGRGVTVIAISDSRASPISALARHAFVVPADTPQFFTSTVAVAALLETLVAFVIADAPREVIANIERFHEQRRALGVYWSPGGG